MTSYQLQKTSIWSFPDRGSWATHKGDYRGNWSPHIPRNLILNYTKPNDIILDIFAGSGTTLIESKLLNRHAIGIDINPEAIKICQQRLNFDSQSQIKLLNQNSMDLSNIPDCSIDFICTHPPYADIIKYSNLPGDLSQLNYHDFLDKFSTIASELYRVLKKEHYCSYMIGDIRKKGNVVPLGFYSMQKFIEAGFTIKEIIIKEQHNCKGTQYWKNKSDTLNFYLLAHEYIFVFVK